MISKRHKKAVSEIVRHYLCFENKKALWLVSIAEDLILKAGKHRNQYS